MRSAALALLLGASAVAALERDYGPRWCEAVGGTPYTIRGADGRTAGEVDCLTETHAIEIDPARRWAEAIGQALYYAAETDRAPGIALYLADPAECRFVPRLLAALEHVRPPVGIWLIGPVRAC